MLACEHSAKDHSGFLGTGQGMSDFAGRDWWQLLGVAIAVCGVHVYAFAKGYR